MKVKVQDLKEGMVVVHATGKGVLVVQSVTPMVIELYPQQYEVFWHGIAAPDQFDEDFEFEVLEAS